MNDALNTEMIADGTHSHPASVAIAYRMKGNERFYLITDAIVQKVLPEGEYDFSWNKSDSFNRNKHVFPGMVRCLVVFYKNESWVTYDLISFTGDTLD